MDFGADVGLPLAEMDGIGFGEPDVAIDACAFVEPAVAEAGVHTDDEEVFLAVLNVVTYVKGKGGVAVVVAADEVAVEEDESAAKGTIEVD